MPVSGPKQGRKGPLFGGFVGTVGLERLLLPPSTATCTPISPSPGGPLGVLPLPHHPETKHTPPKTPCSSSNLFLHESPLYETLPTRLAYTVNKPPAEQHRCPSPAPAAGGPPVPSRPPEPRGDAPGRAGGRASAQPVPAGQPGQSRPGAGRVEPPRGLGWCPCLLPLHLRQGRTGRRIN